MWLLFIILVLIALLLLFIWKRKETYVPMTLSFSITNPDPNLQYNFAFATATQTSDPDTWTIKYNNITSFPLNLTDADSLTLTRSITTFSAAAQSYDPVSKLTSSWTVKTIDIAGERNFFTISSFTPKVGDTTFNIGITVPDISNLTSDSVIILDIVRGSPNKPSVDPRFEMITNTVIGTNSSITIQGTYPYPLQNGDNIDIFGIIRNQTTVFGNGNVQSVKVKANAPDAPDFSTTFGNYTM